KLGIKVVETVPLDAIGAVPQRLSNPRYALNFDAEVDVPRQGSRSELDAQQGIYLTASGTLTQFNAIVAAALCAASATAGSPLFKGIAVAAILLHVAAAFVLCWAARPLQGRERMIPYLAVDDTFQNYRQGWRVTMIAMTVSATALGCFAVETIGAAWKG